MQDRYAGDIGDFGKIGLLRMLQIHGLSVAVNWYRVDPLEIERKEDGTFKQEDGKYLIPYDLRVCAKDLADALFRISKSDNRSVEALEQENMIPGARYYHELLKVENRDEWHKNAMEKLEGSDIVFVNPDNGLLVKSVGKRSARSVKYTFYEEVGDYFQRGKRSVLIYNHRSRKPESVYFHEICSRLQEATGVPESEILKITFPKCSVRDYLAVPAKEHRRIIEETFTAMEESIWGKKGMCRIPRG